MKSSLVVSEESRGGMAMGKFQEGGYRGSGGQGIVAPCWWGAGLSGSGDISGRLLRGFLPFEKIKQTYFFQQVMNACSSAGGWGGLISVCRGPGQRQVRRKG